MAKVINAMSAHVAVAATKKKTVKLASHPAMGALSGIVKETLNAQTTLESDVDKTSEHVENIEFALDSEKWNLSATGAAKVKAQLTAVRKAQKAIAKGAAALLKAAVRAQSELEAARVKDAEPEEDGDNGTTDLADDE